MSDSVDASGSPGGVQAPPLLLTKLHPPTRRDQTVTRDRLLEQLRPRPEVKLTVIAAPAGSGKTTLLGQFRETEATHRPVAWVCLDEGDNDIVALWSHLLESLRQVCPQVGAWPPELVPAPRIADVVLRRLVNELAEQGDVVLILDDFHRLSSGAARDSILWLVDHAPSNLQLVLAARSEPALPLGKLRAHGELVELRADALGFTFDEADELLNGRLGLGLGRGDVELLVERIEGWAAGLYLAGLSLAGVENRHAFVGTFGGTSRHVVDFLVDEVLEAHDRETQTLMLRSAILDRLSGPLCDAVLEQEGSGDLLEALSRANLFLLPLDDRGEWFRFHHLFAQLLRVQLEHREPGLKRGLHRRAYAWHRAHGDVEDAIEHALAAEAFADAAELIAATWIRYADMNRFATILNWLEQLPHDLVRADPALLLVKAWVHALQGEREPAARATMLIEQRGRLDSGPLPDGFSSLEASLTTLRGLIPWGDTRAGLESARRAAELEGPDSPWRPVVCCAVGIGLYFAGEFEEADHWLIESAELAAHRERWLIASTSLSHRSLVAGELGRVNQQALLAEQAVALVQKRGSEELDAEAFVALGASLAARERLVEALPLLERGVAGLRSRGHPRTIADALIRYAAALKAADWGMAGVLAEARTIVNACPDPGVLEERLVALERPSRPRRRARESALSRRELVILRMLGGTLSERDIGRELYLSHNTIHSHTKSIYRKLGASSRSEALDHARQHGLI